MEKNRSLKYHLNNINELIDCMLNDEQFSLYDLQQLQEHLRKLYELVADEVSMKFEMGENEDKMLKNQSFSQSFKEKTEPDVLIKQPCNQNNCDIISTAENDIRFAEENYENISEELSQPYDEEVELKENVVFEDVEDESIVSENEQDVSAHSLDYNDNYVAVADKTVVDNAVVNNEVNVADDKIEIADNYVDNVGEDIEKANKENEVLEDVDVVEGEQVPCDRSWNKMSLYGDELPEASSSEPVEQVVCPEENSITASLQSNVEEIETNIEDEPESVVYEEEVEDDVEEQESGEYEEDVVKYENNGDKMPFSGVKNDNSDVYTIAEVIGKQYEQVSIGDKIIRANNTNLKNAIDISDKFMFIKNLFDNDVKAYNETIEKFNSFSSKNDAMIYLQLLINRYDWDYNSRIFQKFELIVSRKFEA